MVVDQILIRAFCSCYQQPPMTVTQTMMETKTETCTETETMTETMTSVRVVFFSGRAELIRTLHCADLH